MQATYISSNSFSVSGDKTLEFVSGRRLRADCVTDGIKYCTVSSSSYPGPNTTVITKESELTSNLTSVLYGIVEPGAAGSFPDHLHDGEEGSGGLITAGSTTLSGLSDTPDVYDDGKYLRSTVSGTEWATVSGGGASDVQTFLDLTDTPSDYDSGKYVVSTTSGVGFSDELASSVAAKGIQSIKVEYKDADEVYINPGVIHINDGSTDNYYQVSSQFSKQLTGLSGDAWYYIYATPPTTGNELAAEDIEYTTNSGIFDIDRRGYYHTTSSGWRCIGFIYTDDSDNISEYKMEGSRYTFNRDISVFGWATISSDTSLTLCVPFGDMFGIVRTRAGYLASTSDAYLYTFGEATNQKHFGSVTAASTRASVVMDIRTDGLKRIGIRATVYDIACDMRCHGFVVPDEIYTGPASSVTIDDPDHNHTTFSGTSVHVDGDVTVAETVYAHEYDSYSPLIMKAGGTTVISGSDTTGVVDFPYGITTVEVTTSGIDDLISLYEGKQSLRVLYKDADEIYINPGKVEINSALYKVTSQITKQLPSLTAETWYYIYVKPPSSGKIISSGEIEYTSTVPTEDLVRMGWYHGTNTNWRCIGVIYALTTDTVFEFDTERGLYRYSDDFLDYNAVVTTSYASVYFTTPTFAKFIQATFRASTFNINSTIRYRHYGSSGYHVVLMYNTTGRVGMNTSIVKCNSSQRGQVYGSGAGTNVLMISTNGFILPDLIYTGM